MSDLFEWKLDNTVPPAGMAISEGQVVQIEGTTTVVLGDTTLTTASNQATAEVEIPRGVAVADCVSGAVPAVVSEYGSHVKIRVSANSNDVVEGEYCAIEVDTGHLLGIVSDSLTIAAGDWICARALAATSAGALGWFSWEPRKFEDTDT